MRYSITLLVYIKSVQLREPNQIETIQIWIDIIENELFQYQIDDFSQPWELREQLPEEQAPVQKGLRERNKEELPFESIEPEEWFILGSVES